MSRVLLMAVAVAIGALFISAPVAAKGFVQGIAIDVDGEDYYLAEVLVENDVIGHYWVQAGPKQLVGKHYNDYYNSEPFWSDDAPENELLYVVHGIIDTWTREKAELYASRGYVHYHELAAVSDGTPHPNKVVWLKHTARTRFTFTAMGMERNITPGIDWEFMPNWQMPYTPPP